MNVHLIDGTYELFRAYYGGPRARTKSGREVGASRTLARSLLSMLRDPDVTHVACAFDHVIESFRNELFAGYKSGAGIEPELRAQFEVAERVSLALGLVTWPMVEHEADDALATAAERCRSDDRVRQVLLCSADKDLAQCVRGERVVLLDRMRQKLTDENGVRTKFGVPPGAIPDYLALVGDAADGIPGIPGWGPKSAAALLAAYSSLDAIPETASSWSVAIRGADRLARTLGERRQDALLYKRLATLRVDVPLDFTVDALEWRGFDALRLDALCGEIDDAGLPGRASTVVALRRQERSGSS